MKLAILFLTSVFLNAGVLDSISTVEAEVNVVKTLKIKEGRGTLIQINFACIEDQIFIVTSKEFKPLTTPDMKRIITCKEFNPTKN